MFDTKKLVSLGWRGFHWGGRGFIGVEGVSFRWRGFDLASYINVFFKNIVYVLITVH